MLGTYICEERVDYQLPQCTIYYKIYILLFQSTQKIHNRESDNIDAATFPVTDEHTIPLTAYNQNLERISSSSQCSFHTILKCCKKYCLHFRTVERES
ncbi:unnamed protein product, partial [Ceratitis capitata]